MTDAGHLRESEVETIKADVQRVVDEAVQYALDSREPTMDAAWQALRCNRGQEMLT
jgi:pyruvate dehydrogenase E1 component subunit alpha